jgi:hypothetical protein
MVVNRDGRGAEGKRDACERQEYSFAIFRFYQILGERIDNDKNMRATKNYYSDLFKTNQCN